MAQPCSSQLCLWCNLPQLAFYTVLESLDSLADLEAVSRTCLAWYCLVNRDAFWRGYLCKNYPNYRRSDPHPPMAPTPRDLAIMLYEARPDTLECASAEHSDEVLHVAAPNHPAGRYFATASKDGTVKLWPLDNPAICYRTLYFNEASLIDSLPNGVGAESNPLELPSQFDRLYCQYVEFQPYADENGDVLLISRAKREAERGEIAIYNIELDVFLSRAALQTYDVFGCFLDSYHYLSGTFEYSPFNNTSVSRVLIHRIGLLTSNGPLLLELRNIPESVSLQAYTGHPAATVRRLMIAQGGRMCLGTPGRCGFNCGRYQTEASRMQYLFDSSRLSGGFDSGDSSNISNCLRDPEQCRCREKLLIVNRGRNYFLSECVCVRRLARIRPPWIAAYERHLRGFHGPDSGAGFNDPDADPCRWASRSIYSDDSIEANPNRRDPINVHNNDWEVSVGGHVIGMSLSPDHRFLYVNVRPWRNAQFAAELSESAEIHVLDLLAYRYYGKVYAGHKGFTPSAQCFFLFMDAGSRLVCSGSKDCQAYVWDRIYGTKLCTLRHDSVVNACALSYNGLLITVSDDCTVKVWSSRRYRLLRERRLKELKKQHSTKNDD